MTEAPFDLEAVTARIESLLGDLIRAAGLQLTVQIEHTAGVFKREFENPDVLVSLDGRDAELLLENKGELLKALEGFVLEAARVPHDHHEKVFFDCREYRMMRVDELQMLAQTAAEKVRHTGVSYQFNPMSSRERRILHMALRNEQGVRSESEGMGQFRKVVVHSTAPQPAKPRAHRR